MPEIILHIESDPGYTRSQVDTLSRQLVSDIRTARAFTVRMATDQTSVRDKSSGAQQIATLVISGVFSAASLSVLRDVVVAYIDRTKVRSVSIRLGDAEVTLTGASKSDLSEIVKQLPAIADDSGSTTKQAT